MKLLIRRDQKAKTGMLGGHKGMKFSLSCRVELSEEEKQLLEKYKAEDMVLGTYTLFRGTKDELEWEITIGKLVRGDEDKIDNIVELLEREEKIKEACRTFKLLLERMANFGGEEVVDI